MDSDGIVALVRELGLTGIAPPREAGPNDVAVLWDARAGRSGWGQAGLLILGEDADLPDSDHLGRVERTRSPGRVFVDLLNLFHPKPGPAPGIHPSAVVDASASVAPSASVGPLVVVEADARVGEHCVLRARSFVGRAARLGEGCVLDPGALVLDGCLLGDGVLVGPGSVIGGRGFGYLDPEDGIREAIPQVGRVVLEDGVHVGSLCAVDRGTLSDTRIGAHARLDNHVVVGHNVTVGTGAVLVSQAGLSGSVTVGPGAILAAGAGVADHRRVGAGAVITARASVYRDVPAGAVYSGSPARPRVQHVQEQAALGRVARERLRHHRATTGGPEDET